jgi:hypothetical protein
MNHNIKILIAFILCSVTFTSAIAATGKEPKEKDIKLNIHIDKNGDVHITGKNISDKDIENWVSDHLTNLNIDIDENAVNITSNPDKGKKKSKAVQLSLTIKEK